LIELDQDAVGDASFNALADALFVSRIKVVADDLDSVADGLVDLF